MTTKTLTLEQKIHERAVEINAKTVACYPSEPEPETEPEPEVSEQHVAIQKALDGGDWGCQKASVYRLAEAITGEMFKRPGKTESPEYREDLDAVVGICVVPTANTNVRSEEAAPTGKVMFVVAVDEGDNEGYMDVGMVAGWLPNCSSESRPATVDEVEELLLRRAMGDV